MCERFSGKFNMLDIKKIKQAVLLGAGLVIGQGFYFFGISRLVALGELDRLGAIGVMLSLLALAQWMGDCGGLIFQAKLAQQGTFRSKFVEFTLARIVVGSAYCTFLMVALELIKYSLPDYFWVLMYINTIVWSMNFSGFLDHINKNKFVGPLSGLNWAMPGLAILFDPIYFDDISLAIKFTAGTTLTLLFQMLAVVRSVNKFKIVIGFSVIDFLGFLKEFFVYNIGFSVGQSYARIVPVVVSGLSGSSIAGLYVYAKSVANAIGQIYILIRRTSHSDIVRLAGRGGCINVAEVVLTNRLGLLFLLGTSLFSLGVVLLCGFFVTCARADVIFLSAAMVAILPVWGVSYLLGVLLSISGRAGTNSTVLSLVSTICLLGIFIGLNSFGVYYLVFVELLNYSVMLFLLSYFARRGV